MCAIIGIVGRADVAGALYDGLTVLQHRGQDAAGIATVDARKLRLHKGTGLVRDVFGPSDMEKLSGHYGIGHCRYPTAGSDSTDEAQPFYVNSPFGIALAHNGNLTNMASLRREVFEQDLRHCNTESDSEVLLNVLAHELEAEGKPLDAEKVFNAVARVHARCVGGYAVIALILGVGVLAFRDPHGIRPLVFGKRASPGVVDEFAVASESVAFDALGFELVRDVRPGEAVLVSPEGDFHSRQCVPSRQHAPCIFEYVYLARPDSMIEEISVHKARMRMGEKLAQKIRAERPDHDIDVVIPIPDTSRTAAMELAHTLGIKYREGFIKNRYIGRTFIMPGQSERMKSVRRKLNAIPLEFRNRVVLLVDDSIVRGTTSQQIIQMARDAGARKVYFASAAPPVRFPNVYGIDMPAADELIAHGRTQAEIERLLGCDWLIYQDLADLVDAVAGPKRRVEHFDTSCFSGEYVTGLLPGYLDRLKHQRSDDAKSARRNELEANLATSRA